MSNDLISRQAAIDDFYKYPNITWTTLDVLKHINALPSVQPYLTNEDMRLLKKLRTYHNGTYAKAIDHVMAKASAQPEQHWIPCSERLPEPWKPVLWIGKHGNIYIKPFDGSFIENIAWMPLPEPYQGERREDEQMEHC